MASSDKRIKDQAGAMQLIRMWVGTNYAGKVNKKGDPKVNNAKLCVRASTEVA